MNDYSAQWRAAFEPDGDRTAEEVRFLCDALPLPAFRRVLDVACGSGRHERALVPLGYDVVGLDNDPSVSPDVVADMRDLDRLPGDFDAVVSWWASFGYFDDDENVRVLGSFARRLRPDGRLILDLYNREFFDGRPRDERDLAAGVVECSLVVGNRRHVELRYPDGRRDVFDWQLYAPDELVALASARGLRPISVTASPGAPRMRLLLVRGTPDE